MSGLLNKLTDECGHIIPSSPFEFGIRGAKTAVQTTMVVICAGCERPILDRFLLNVLDRAWHSKCVQCFDCKANLTEKCFSRDGKLYCREDFFRRFGTKCGGCSQGISPNDLVRRARNKVFHLKCFTCMVCRKQLSTGEELYVLDENKFICKEDYIQSKYQGSDVEDDNDMDFDQAMLDKMDDAMSDKTSTSLHDDDSIDSAIPLSNGLHANGPSPGNLSNGTTLPGAGMSSPIGANASNLGPLPDLAHERNNNSDIIIKKEKKSLAPKDGSRSVSGDSSDASSVDTNTKDGVEKDDKEKNNNKENSSKEDGTGPTGGTKRRGPRTTIKAKQLETLKAAFAATPKPTRHIREQLAQETGLNMRVIQVWFQNRRSKERRMKQLSALGARRQFFRNPRRLRALRPGEDLDSPDMMGQPGFNYFENGEFYPGYPGYEYFPQPGEMSFLPPNSGPPGNPPMVDQPVPGQMPPGHPDAHYLPSEMGHLPPTSSPEPHIGSMHPDAHPFIPGSLPPRSMPGNFGQTMPHPQQEMAQETW